MAGDEEGFLEEREGVEVVEGERKEVRRGEDGGEAAMVAVEEGGNGGSEI